MPPNQSKKYWALTPPAFRRLLDWFDEGTNSGGRKYEEIRRRLILYFDRRDCLAPEDLADEALDRVARRLEEVGSITNIEPANFCHLKAKEVLLEYWRKPERKQIELDDPQAHDPADRNANLDGTSSVQGEKEEKRLECLEQCLQKLEPGDRNLIIQYYYGEKRVKIENHRKMAGKLEISDKALTLRALRIRKKLEVCVNTCVGG